MFKQMCEQMCRNFHLEEPTVVQRNSRHAGWFSRIWLCPITKITLYLLCTLFVEVTKEQFIKE